MLTMEFVAAVHALVAVVAYLSLGAYVVLTYNRYNRHEELTRRAKARIALGKLDLPKILINTVIAMVVSALVGSAWYGFLTLVAALI